MSHIEKNLHRNRLYRKFVTSKNANFGNESFQKKGNLEIDYFENWLLRKLVTLGMSHFGKIVSSTSSL